VTWWRIQGDRLVLELHVQPGARRTQVAGLHGDRLKVRVGARAVEGEANAALVEFLAERLGVARRDVTIEAGAGARAKRVSVIGARRGPETLLED
jgi:uncharacterized protein (TIGR00251 family)